MGIAPYRIRTVGDALASKLFGSVPCARVYRQAVKPDWWDGWEAMNGGDRAAACFSGNARSGLKRGDGSDDFERNLLFEPTQPGPPIDFIQQMPFPGAYLIQGGRGSNHIDLGGDKLTGDFILAGPWLQMPAISQDRHALRHSLESIHQRSRFDSKDIRTC